MRNFMDENFLLDNKMSETLFHDYAADCPIFDYHCHLIPSQIADNKRFSTITDAWLGGDHYKWRQMRWCGFEEKLITGDADPFDKFMAWAETMENLIGNPLYHWTHLELQRYFGIHDVLSRKTARKIYDEANEKFASDPELSVYGIMKKFKVYAVGTTDDPADDLLVHKRIIDEGTCPTKVMPSFRPDKAIHIEKPDFAEYIGKLAASADMEIRSASDVIDALLKRLDFFIAMGCKATDHGILVIPNTFWEEKNVDLVFQKKMNGGDLTPAERNAWETYVLLNMAKAYHKRNIVMQLHFNVIRDNNAKAFAELGVDTGYDSCYDADCAQGLSDFMKKLSETDEIPKTIIYSLNPKDYYAIMSLIGSWQGTEVAGKVQMGSAWWFNDHKDGMEFQLKTFANLGTLPKFVGMLTDSRSFLSYPRHEYFRRILCNVIGTWADHGEVPADEEFLGQIVKDISFYNAQRYFEG